MGASLRELVKVVKQGATHCVCPDAPPLKILFEAKIGFAEDPVPPPPGTPVTRFGKPGPVAPRILLFIVTLPSGVPLLQSPPPTMMEAISVRLMVLFEIFPWQGEL